MTVVGECSLCLETGELQLGHIIPKFVTKFIKNHSEAPHKRLLGVGAQLLQDSPKRHMFCRKCEQLLGKDEKLFNENALSDAALFSSQLRYDGWMLRFAAGLLLRTMIDNRALHETPQRKELERAERSLAKFLLKGAPTGYALLRISVGIQDPERLTSTRMRTPYEQALTAGTTWGVRTHPTGQFLAVFAQIPFHVFWMPVVPKRVKESEWQNVKIRRRGVFDANQPQVCPVEYHRTIDFLLAETEPLFRESARRADVRQGKPPTTERRSA